MGEGLCGIVLLLLGKCRNFGIFLMVQCVRLLILIFICVYILEHFFHKKKVKKFEREVLNMKR